MADIIWTPPSGWVEESGAHVCFKAPADGSTVGNLLIGSNTYALVDALGNPVTGVAGAFTSGAVLDLVLDCDSPKTAYLLNYARGLQLKKLWENSNPESSFAAQTITLADTSKTVLFVRCRWSTSDPDGGPCGVLIKGAGKVGFEAEFANREAREAEYTSEGDVVFMNGYYNGSTNNTYCIPTSIWGV